MSLTRYFTYAMYSRFKPVRDFAWRVIGSEGHTFSPPGSAARVLVGGDVSLDLEMRIPRYSGVYCLGEETAEHWVLERIRLVFWKMLCRLFFSDRFFSAALKRVTFRELLVKGPKNEKRGSLGRGYRTAIRFNVDYPSVESRFAYPFEKISSFMKSKDLVLVNLETPLTVYPRVRGFFASDPRYARAMMDAGISMVSLANNHIFDADEIGFLQTLDHLEDAGLFYVGAGSDFEDARLGRYVQLNDTKLVFLSYTQFCNAGFVSVAAEYPGILPLDRELIVRDIEVAKKKAELVFVSLHWGFEDQPSVHPKQVEIAHSLIDAGADVIIGHHPHVPHGIEIYKRRPILYSLGNFIFGQGMIGWADNYLAEIVIDRKQVQGIMIYPISGRGQELFQPELLNGARAESLLHELQIKSAVFNTGIAIQDYVGYIKI